MAVFPRRLRGPGFLKDSWEESPRNGRTWSVQGLVFKNFTSVTKGYAGKP